jgi:hypothetical protein
MHGKDNQLIDGNGRAIDDEHINITLRKSDLEKFKRNQSGEFIQIHLKRRYQPDKYNNTHVVVSGHFHPSKEEERQPPNVDNKGRSTLDYK